MATNKEAEKNVKRRIKLAKISFDKGIKELETARDLAFQEELNGTGINLTKDLEAIENLSIYAQL